jgi:hypothetical protein
MLSDDPSGWSLRDRLDDLTMGNGPSTRPFSPPIRTIDLPEGHPQAAVMRMIMSLTLDGIIDWIASRHLLLVGADDRPQDRLRPGEKPIGCEELSIVENIDSIGLLFERELGLGSVSQPRNNDREKEEEADHVEFLLQDH